MTVDEAIKLKQEGKRIPNKDWSKFSEEEKKKISIACGANKDKEGIPWKNDWRFYAINEQIAKDFGSIPYNVLAGIGAIFKLFVPADATATTKLKQHSLTVREMCCTTIDYWQMPGIATSKTDGINMAATQLYTFIRRANSGARNYEAADVMMYILAMAEIYAEYFEIKRALGVANLYQIENHNLPDTLLTAMGLDATNLRDAIAQYRGKLNLLCAKINALAVPGYFRMFDRIAYITTKVFADSTSIRGQFYIFKRSGYRTWSAKTSERGSSLQATRWPINETINLAEKIDVLTSMLDAMFLDDDINTMSGDILKAFGQDKLYQVVPTTEDYIVMPTYDEDILAQIENSYAYTSYTGGRRFEDINQLNILQENQLLKVQPTMDLEPGDSDNMSTIAVMNTKYFNSHKDDPTFMDTVEWSRLITTAEYDAETDNIVITSCGQELVEGYQIWKRDENDGDNTIGYVFSNTIVANARLNPNLAQNLETIAKVGQYDWHPGVYVVYGNNSSDQQWSINPLMDLKKFAVVDDTTIIPLHQSAVSACLWADDLYKTATRS